MTNKVKVEVLSEGHTYVAFGDTLCEAHANMTKTLTKHGVMKIDSMTTYVQSDGGYFPTKKFHGDGLGGLNDHSGGDGI